jgi:hypothetical protein
LKSKYAEKSVASSPTPQKTYADVVNAPPPKFVTLKPIKAEEKKQEDDKIIPESMMNGNINVPCPATESPCGIMVDGEFQGSLYEAIKSPRRMGQFSVVGYEDQGGHNKKCAIFPRHYFDKPGSMHTPVTFVGKNNRCVTIESLAHATPFANKNVKDMIFLKNEEITTMTKAVPLASGKDKVVLGQKIPGQLLFRWFSETTSQGCLLSLGNCLSGASAATSVSYNSVPGSCGGVVTNSNNHAVGMHVGTTMKSNTMLALTHDLFEDADMMDFRRTLD